MSITQLAALEQKATRHLGACFTALINGDKVEVTAISNGLYTSFSYKKNGVAVNREKLLN